METDKRNEKYIKYSIKMNYMEERERRKEKNGMRKMCEWSLETILTRGGNWNEMKFWFLQLLSIVWHFSSCHGKCINEGRIAWCLFSPKVVILLIDSCLKVDDSNPSNLSLSHQMLLLFKKFRKKSSKSATKSFTFDIYLFWNSSRLSASHFSMI